jgi:hypothetical protein
VECVLATSNRGGRRVRNSNVTVSLAVSIFELVNTDTYWQKQQQTPLSYIGEQRSLPNTSSNIKSHDGPPSGLGDFGRSNSGQDVFHESISASNIEETIASTDLHQTSDALNLLSQAAELGTNILDQSLQGNSQGMNPITPGNNLADLGRSGGIIDFSNGGPLQYEVVARGLLTAGQVGDLVAR